ncbi:hypothetical protein [Alicyclobacillus ferrooxydans]|uniref:Uncharacterized protein n=1 Tax=Alicyclobacillus ferrooxydans TaxID=471514 RepID=A0A0P9EQ41_9BACL|nr:hypothetical protein [Alicyclobacillus ferrooxydans]KPV45655.1 hypothetical protein AN477_01710 [Alicyclobacillus ferrooxydans]
MSKLRRFPLTYDEEFDADIHKMLMETPQKRRSERLRQLIRLGLSVESGHYVEPTNRVPQPKQQPSNNLAIQSERPVEPSKRVRNPLRFEPPS